MAHTGGAKRAAFPVGRALGPSPQPRCGSRSGRWRMHAPCEVEDCTPFPLALRKAVHGLLPEPLPATIEGLIMPCHTWKREEVSALCSGAGRAHAGLCWRHVAQPEFYEGELVCCSGWMSWLEEEALETAYRRLRPTPVEGERQSVVRSKYFASRSSNCSGSFLVFLRGFLSLSTAPVFEGATLERPLL
jgi:hypothetical protein